MGVIGRNVRRKDGWEKVDGTVKFVNDDVAPGLLYVALVTSQYAHAHITKIDMTAAMKLPGVKKVVTGSDYPILTGPIIVDRPPLAIEKVRYYGEPIAAVAADTEEAARAAAGMVKVTYDPLPVVLTPIQALQKQAPIIHKNLQKYKHFGQVFPTPGTNIANHTKIRKGQLEQGWAASDVIVENEVQFGPADHAAIEPRSVMCEITNDGKIHIHSTTQSPYLIKKYLDRVFKVGSGNVIVHTPPVGGGFGGKGAVQLEYIAYLVSKAVGGNLVKVTNTRENDLITSPCHIGLTAQVRLGATQSGELQAAEIIFYFDGGAYSDMGVMMSKSAAGDCTGPYAIQNVKCDSYCVYTNHTYSTSFRGFGHPELTFAIERTIDILARKLKLDPFELRFRNAIQPGQIGPTRVVMNASILGDVKQCLSVLKQAMNWDGVQKVQLTRDKWMARGFSCYWKTSSTPTNAGSGAVITFNSDGSLNLSVGAVELGQGARTVLPQIAAETLKMDPEKVHISLSVDTIRDPEHWKTVASNSTFMVGRAVIEAANDAKRQLKHTASIVLKCLPEDLVMADGKVFLKSDPAIAIDIMDICMGYRYPNGNSIVGQVIGRGNYIVTHLTPLDPETGAGRSGMQWTVGAQGVDIEFDTRYCTYRIVKAYTVIDAGNVVNPRAAWGQMAGGMSIGLSWASRESFLYSSSGIVLDPTFRDYKLLRIPDAPEYDVRFVETPCYDGPYGVRGIGEYGVIGAPAALANALSIAADVELNHLPLIPEYIWRMREGRGHDSL